MKKTLFCLTVCVCILNPAAARANDGGFWDMLFHWDPKFSEYGTEFHLACLDASGKRISGCEEWFRNFWLLFNPRAGELATHPFDFKEIKHEIDFRLSLMHTYGDVVSDLPSTDPDPSKKVWAMKLMGVYHYHVNPQLEFGVAAGAIPIFGGGSEAFWRGILTPISVIVSPSSDTRFYFRFEESYITNRITAASLGHPLSSFAKDGEWNFSATFGIDLRRIGQMKVARP